MIHFKTIEYPPIQPCRFQLFFYEEKNVYYSKIDDTIINYCYVSVLKWWFPTVVKISLTQYISNNIIIEYHNKMPDIEEIISDHNKSYTRLKKIYKLL